MIDAQSEYMRKKRTADEIAEMIHSGWVCCSDIAAGIPTEIIDAIGQRAADGRLENLKFHALLDLEHLGILDEKALKGIRPVSWFSGSKLSAAVNKGTADCMPCYYRDIPELFRKHIETDAFIVKVAPMDSHGYFSTGVNGSFNNTMFENARNIFLEVNPGMPRALSAPQIHISHVTALCESDRAMPLISPLPFDETAETIGRYIAEEVPDGATIQLGIGAIPDAVGSMLKGKKELGIHTELFSDVMLDLIECGAVTNNRKPLYRGMTVSTLAFGSRRVYDFINDNPAFMLLPVSITNDPAVIARHPDFISVNGGLEVDFFGQVCAESIGVHHVSGSGGQSDFVRGAVKSEGGKSFIAFPSTAGGGKISRIKSVLTEGALVTTSKNDVDNIVTEFGVARLRGRTLSERTKALIAIAHPKFREELTFAARQRNILI